MTGSRYAVKCFIPGEYYVSLSVTGTYCELNCPLCRGKFLKSMIDVSNPSRFAKVLEHLYRRGVRGFLISGGFNKEGRLMISKDHLDVIARFKRKYSNETVISMHTGLIPIRMLHELWSIGVDFIDFEIPPSNEFLIHMRNLRNVDTESFVDVFYEASRIDKRFIVPHLITLSPLSTEEQERGMIKRITEINSRLIVILVQIGPKLSYDLDRLERILKLSRERFNEVSLGCMRPKEVKEYDEYVISNGLVDRIAVPSASAIKRLHLRVFYACCSVPEDKLKLFPTT